MQPPEDSDGALDRHSGSDRLDSWKAIAEYLSRDVRTVQRWEKTEGLPVHRHVHEKLSSVYAYQSELEAWLAAREEPEAVSTPESPGASGQASIPSDSGTDTEPASAANGARRHVVVAAVALLVLLVALGIPWLNRPDRDAAPTGTPPEPRPRSWILVSDFEGPPDDADLAVAVRELVVASLTNSDAVTPISRTQIQKGLRLAMRPDTTRISGEVARELANRASARTYVEGRIDRIESGYSIVLHIQDAETSGIVASVRGVAERQADLITTLDQLGRDLRERIGENRARVRANRPFVEAITPSFEAYRKHVRQQELHLAGEHRGSLRLGHEAVQLDPDFALAYHQLGTTHSSLGVLDSAQVWWNKALQRPNRLTEMQQLGIRALMAAVLDRDLDEFIRLQTLIIQQEQTGYNNLGVALGLLGRYEDALTAFRNAEVETPFGAEQLHLANEFSMLLRLGRIEQAHRVVPELQGHYRRSADLTLALAASQWDDADRLAAAQESDDTVTPLMRYWARQTRASIAAVRGDRVAAEAALEALLDDGPNLPSIGATRFALVHLRRMASHGTSVDEARDDPLDLATDALLSLGVECAARGDTARATQYLRVLEERPGRDARRYATDLLVLRASIAAAHDRWDEVIELLEPLTLRGMEPNFTGRLAIRWLVAEACEQQQQLERAAMYFEQALSPEGLVRWWSGANEIALRGLTEPFARLRLVSLYARLGELESAQRHWRILDANCTNPDAFMEERMREVRGQLEALETASS